MLGSISARVLIMNQSVRACDLGKLLLLGVSGTVPCSFIECITACVPPVLIVSSNSDQEIYYFCDAALYNKHCKSAKLP